MQNLAKLTVLKRGLTLTKIASQNNDSEQAEAEVVPSSS